jgi:DNA-binding PadR family transcriptional regulator
MFDELFRFAWGWEGGPSGPEDAPEEPRDPRGTWPPFGGPQFRQFWGLFGPNGPGSGGRSRGPNMYGRGDLKFVLLDLLQTRPMHGYEMIKELESRAGGFYTPSAGAVYPTLQLLEDRGWVTSATVEGKKVYTITDAGRAGLQERSERPQEPRHGPEGAGGPGPGFGPRHSHHGPRGPWGRHASPELEALGRETFMVAKLMRDAVMRTQGDPAKLAELRKIVLETRAALEAFVQGKSAAPEGDTPPAAPPPEVV